ncbi:neuroligin-4, X-linked-like [Watersipora subatra]|uniref:neuroligin-4, X-linked-like n=1 Tax=Watersipora subatra TaxID=2589382 RepID=UPI00355BF94A
MEIHFVISLLLVVVPLSHTSLTFDTLSDRVVTTDAGRLRGVQIDFRDTGLQSVEAYLGLQYASLHNGALRFMPPTSPTEKWNGVKIVNVFRPVCPQKRLDFDNLLKEMPAARVERLRQISAFTKDQSEECLFLNIYVPAKDRQGPAPVVVFVHGESYDYGTGNAYDGSVLSSQADIVVITLNYRLGALGFLSTEDGQASGNYALFDLIAAVHWIKANIAVFGGDRSQVTIMGQGYGAALANILALAPISGRLNLFNRLILQSGSALSFWAMADNPMRATNRLATAVRCPVSILESGDVDTVGLLVCLRAASHNDLMNADTPSNKFVTDFGPVIDKVILEAEPEQLMKSGDTLFSEIELLFGVAQFEGSHLLSQRQLDEGVTQKEKRKILREYVKANYQEHQQKIYDILNHTYSYREDRNDTNQLKHKMIEFLGDGQYNLPAALTGQYHLEQGKETYFYVFSHSSRQKDFPQYQNGHHGEDLPYVFGAPLSNNISPFVGGTYSNNEKVLGRAVIRFFGNFIKSGNPNIPFSDRSSSDIRIDSLRFLDVYWPQYESDSEQYLQLGTKPLVRHRYRGERVALWTELIPKLLESSSDGSEGTNWDDLITNSPKDMGVRHVPPQPPTPPMIPPYRPSSTTAQTSQGDEAGKIQPDVYIEKPTEVKVVTKIVEVVKYRNITVSSAVAESREGVQLSTTLSITFGVGAAFVFLNVCLLIIVCCQRDKLRAERRLISKQKQPVAVAESVTQLKTDLEKSQVQPTSKLLETHLYEKSNESDCKGSIVDKRHTSISSERSEKSDATVIEPLHSLTKHNRTDNGCRSEADTDSERLVIRGVPQEPAKPPLQLQHDILFETCGSTYSSQSRSGSRQHLNEHRGSQHSLSHPHPRGREFSPRGGMAPIPQQRTPDSLARLNSSEHDLERRDVNRRYDSQRPPYIQSPRANGRSNVPEEHFAPHNRRDLDVGRSYDSNSFRRMNHPNSHFSNRSLSENGYYTDTTSPRRQHQPRNGEEPVGRSPRRLKYHDDGGSSDSGVQHMSYNLHTFS